MGDLTLRPLLPQGTADLFVGRPWSVAMEEKLSLKSQRLDILIIERCGAAGAAADPEAVNGLPDGFDNLAAHNLLSYKSAAEPFNTWVLEELISHYVTYRKLASLRAAHRGARTADEPLAEPAGAYPLLPARDVRCFAVATRQPRQLMRQLAVGTCRATACPGSMILRSAHCRCGSSCWTPWQSSRATPPGDCLYTPAIKPSTA